MMAANGQGGPPPGGSGSSGSHGGGSSKKTSSQGSSKKSAGKGQGKGASAPAARPSLKQLATAAGVAEEIDEPIQVFAYGTTKGVAQELVETQGGNLSATGGNFGGKLFTVPSAETAEVFAQRAATHVAGEQPGVVGIALPESTVAQLRSQGLLKLSPIDNPPAGVSAGAQQWVFEPGAIQTLKNQGFFFKVR
jgi:hypothetical protein